MSGQDPIFGVDIGGSGVKGAPVDVASGVLVSERVRIDTPEPATPDAVADVVAEIIADAGYRGPVGVTVPAVVKSNVVQTASNIDPSWIGCDYAEMLERTHDIEAIVLNDADAAGVAEMTFGAGRDRSGVVFLATLGTGIGTALFIDGRLVPNTELGHIELHGDAAEKYAAAKVRKREDLDWSTWAKRVDEYLHAIERLLWPDLVILGGGVSKKTELWFDELTVSIPLAPAQLRNNAGIVGAAMAVAQR